MQLLFAVIALGGLGLLFGLLIALVSKFFTVVTDERIDKIADTLPNGNCGGCGYSGCKAYANAIVSDGVATNLCPVGGASVATEIAEIMGVSAGEFVEKKAVVLCCGTTTAASLRFDYGGIFDCAVANRTGGGQKACLNGCLGFGNCVAVCDRDAIEIIDGVAQVNDNCKGCGQCAKACPKGLIKIVSKSVKYVVSCSSHLKGAALKDKCQGACIGCKLCEKACEQGAITVTDNLAVIDYDKCTSCGACAEKCPKKVIKDVTVKPEKKKKVTKMEVKKEKNEPVGVLQNVES